jgi:hypothetical protein
MTRERHGSSPRVPFSIVVETYTRHMFDFPLTAAK